MEAGAAARSQLVSEAAAGMEQMRSDLSTKRGLADAARAALDIKRRT